MTNSDKKTSRVRINGRDTTTDPKTPKPAPRVRINLTGKNK
jgi:hypothetical protein